MNIDYPAILTANYSGTLWIMNGDDYSGLVWLDATPKPTQAALDALWPTVAYNGEITVIATTRRTQYEAQSDGIYFEWQRGTNTQAVWEAAVQAVKDANPYPPAP